MAGATSVGAAGVSGLSALSAMNPYTAALSAAVPLAQGIYGIAQKAKANKLRKQFDQPMYAIPGAIDEATGIAQSLAYDPSLPGQSLIEAGLDRGLASGNRAIMEAGMSGAERLAAINAGVGNRLDANTALALQMAQQQQQDMQNYQNALNTVAGYQDKQWQLNKQQPWKDAMEAANRLDEAGAQNMMTALKDVTGVGAAAIAKKPGTTTSGGATDATTAFKFNPGIVDPNNPVGIDAMGVTQYGTQTSPADYTQSLSWTDRLSPPAGNFVGSADPTNPFGETSYGTQTSPMDYSTSGTRPTVATPMTQYAIAAKKNPMLAATGLDFLSQLGGQMMGMK